MRYLPLTDTDRRLMLERIGVAAVDDLFADVPEAARLAQPLPALPRHQAEFEVERLVAGLAAKNLSAARCPSFLGAGAYRHHIPASVDQLLLRGEFLTSYTPYQPEVSQGTLQALFEFQTQVALLTGMEVANASMYDGATACAEAVMMANRVTGRSKALLSGGLHPHYRDVVQTLAQATGFAMNAPPADPFQPGRLQMADLASRIDAETSCVVVQNPNFFGRLRDLTPLTEACQAQGALLVVVVAEVVSLGLLQPPGAYGADIVVAEGQSLGNGLSFGGPHVGLFACKAKYVRQMPGRLCGQTVDADGRRGFVLTLSTREQHIRREKATSNICTNSGLCALAFSIHLSLLGEDGFTGLAELNHAKAVQFAEMIGKVTGCRVINDSFFNEFTIELPVPAEEVVEKMALAPILAGVPVSRLFPDDPTLDRLLLVAVTELTQTEDMDAFIQHLRGCL
ncbi:MAG: aminomethyl-transferring glycine dehydrogenase subunit GcvPA [Candidatus Methylumidiphilus sp.]